MITTSDYHLSIILDLLESEVNRQPFQYSRNMAMSKPASEQELAEKHRRELKASTILTEFAKRHRRKLEASRFLLKLERPLDTTEAVAQAAGISSPNGCAISATDSSGKVGSFSQDQCYQ